MSRRTAPGNRAWERKSLIRRYHPDARDIDEFARQDECQQWRLLWWEKEEQMNRMWWHRLHDWPERNK